MSESEKLNIEQLRKKLMYRASHRGMKEMDVYLGSYAEQALSDMSRQELEVFARLLRITDRELWGYFVKGIAIESFEDAQVESMLTEIKKQWPSRRKHTVSL